MRFGFIVIALSLLAQPALAQSSMSESHANRWAGFYAGAEAGMRRSRYIFSWSDDSFAVSAQTGGGVIVRQYTTFTSSGRLSSKDPVYGGIVGWSGQAGHFVFGLEASGHRGGATLRTSFNAQTVGSSGTVPLQANFSRRLTTQYDLALRARAGYAFGGTLLYVAGGVLEERIRLRVAGTYNSAATTISGNAVPAIGPIVTSGSQSVNFTGWTACGGIEQRLSRHVSIGLDARYDDLGAKGFNVPNQTTTSPASAYYGTGAGAALAAPPSVRVSATGHDPDGDIQGTVRLIYRF